jgi:hypothetical protein
MNSSEESIVKSRVCIVCNKHASANCAKCTLIPYCSRECQLKHWNVHKKTCKTPDQLIEFNRSQKDEIYSKLTESISGNLFITAAWYAKKCGDSPKATDEQKSFDKFQKNELSRDILYGVLRVEINETFEEIKKHYIKKDKKPVHFAHINWVPMHEISNDMREKVSIFFKHASVSEKPGNVLTVLYVLKDQNELINVTLNGITFDKIKKDHPDPGVDITILI